MGLIILVALTAHCASTLVLHNGSSCISLGLSSDHCVLFWECIWRFTLSDTYRKVAMDPLHHYALLHGTRYTIIFLPHICCSFLQVVCRTTGPKPLPKRARRIVRSRASSFKWDYPLLSLRSSSSFLRLLPRRPVTSIHPFIFPSITRCRRQFLRKMWHLLLHILKPFFVIWVLTINTVYIALLYIHDHHQLKKWLFWSLFGLWE